MLNKIKNANRVWLVFYLLVFGYSIMIIKLYILQIKDHKKYTDLSQNQTKKMITLNPNRGDIVDKNNKILVTSQTCYSIYANPKEISDPYSSSKAIAPYITANSEYELYRLLSKNSSFVWIQRKISKETKDKIDSLNLSGFHYFPNYERKHLKGSFASHVLGFVGIDNQGLGGIEFYFDKSLKGATGKIILDTDPYGRDIFNHTKKVQAPVEGQKIQLTLDESIQHFAQTALQKAVIDNVAVNGTSIVMESKTGKILAMATYPDFDPSNFYNYPAMQLRNDSVTSVYEPGSTFKLLTVAIALKLGLITPQTIIYCPPTIMIGNHIIKEAHDAEPGSNPNKSITDIICESLNVGTAKIGIMMSKEVFYKELINLGFGSRTGITLPGESPGILNHYKKWTSTDHARIPFGQGVAVTPVQLIAAINAIVNEGNYVQPTILESDKKIIKRRVLPETTSKQLRAMMKQVVLKGTGTVAKLPYYSSGGKTGTAQKVKEYGFGYEPGKYVSSFIGSVPIDNPELTILVIINSPEKNYFGSLCAAPAFKEIAERSLRYLNIPPDINPSEDIKEN